MKKIVLSNTFTIFRDEFKENTPVFKEEFLKYVFLNDKLSTHTNDNSVWVEFRTPCFERINNQVKSNIESIEGRRLVNFAEHYWVYTQTEGFDLTWMHQHLLVHPGNRSSIATDYTFTYYVQTPKDITGDEGHIIFEDENKNRHKFLPQEGDIFIFPADLRHTAVPTPKSKTDRIVYAGSICIDVTNQSTYNKNIL